jgi:hypothetical protein
VTDWQQETRSLVPFYSGPRLRVGILDRSYKIFLMASKIQIQNAVLSGSPQDWLPQRVASVYSSDGVGYHVYAPARAKGDALEWVEQFVVHQVSKSGQGENDVTNGRKASIINQVKEQLEKSKLSSDIWTWENDDARYYSGQICLRGHVQSADGKNPVEKGEYCQQCGDAVINQCPSCEAPIRGQDLHLNYKYVRPSFCYKCGRPYPWMGDRLQTAKELLYHDDKLSQEDREKLWDLLKYVMSDPKSDLVPAKKKLIEINLAKAGAVTRDIVTDLVAKTIAEIAKG